MFWNMKLSQWSRMVLISMLGLLLVPWYSVHATDVTQDWAALYNGLGNGYDYATDMVVTENGSCFVTGVSTAITGDTDFATVKYDSTGLQCWVVCFDGWNHGNDGAVAIGIDCYGNVFVTGYSDSLGTDIVTVKYGPAGNQLWYSRYAGPGQGNDIPTAMVVDFWESALYITGKSITSVMQNNHYDYITLKYDANSQLSWVGTYDGSATP